MPQVVYDDGDSEERVLAADKVMVGLTAQQQQQHKRRHQQHVAGPSAQQLAALAAAVAVEADLVRGGGAPSRQVDALR